jgi:cytochrome c peroxidase
MKFSYALLMCSGLISMLVACGGGGSTTVNEPATAVALPAGFPEPAVPASNPITADKAELGRFLFYDRRLSGNGTQACASCHLQEKAFTDGRAVAIGSTGELHPRNAQSLTNVAYNTTLTWANPALFTLEKQMEVPLFGNSPVEMGINDDNKAEVLARIAGDAAYRARFQVAFPGESSPVNWDNIIKAISTFQRTLVSGHSKYDQSRNGLASLTASEARGRDLFFGERAECFHCHGEPNFNEQFTHANSRLTAPVFRNTGLFNIDGEGGFPAPNRGVFELTAKPSDMGKFRAPSLRNVAVTAPYMHDGSIDTLEAVLDFYAAGGRVIDSGPHAGDGRVSPRKDGLINNIQLSPQDRADIVAFLKALTDERFLTNPAFSDPFKGRTSASEASHAN